MGKVTSQRNPIAALFSLFPALVDRFFAWYGGYLADHAMWFLIIPILVSMTLAPGMVQLNRNTDDVKIWRLDDGTTLNDHESKKQFNNLPSVCSCYECDKDGDNCSLSLNCKDRVPSGCENIDEGLDRACNNLILMFISTNQSLTDPEVLRELFNIDMRLTYEHHINTMFKPRYFASNNSDQELCQKSADGWCVQYSTLTAVRAMFKKFYGKRSEKEYLGELTQPDIEDMFRQVPNFTHPFSSDEPDATFTGPLFGDVELEEPEKSWRNGFKASNIKHVGAFRMFYCLKTTEEMFDINRDWAEDVRSWLESRYVNNDSFNLFNLEVSSTWTPGIRTGEEIFRLIPPIIISLFSLMVFSGLTTLRGHPAHRAMPWIGPIGVGCSILACAAGFGIVGWAGLEIVDLCFVTPLLILAVGIDDVFVYTESWRFTKPEWSVRKRTVVTMRRAAPGIMVTSFINSLAFIIDTDSPFLAIQIFAYVSVIVAAFDLTFQMTVFPAALVVLAEAEKRARHSCLCCVSIKPRTYRNYKKDSFCYLMCCTAPESTIINADDKSHKKAARSKETKPEEKSGTTKKHFFYDVYAPFLLKPSVTVLVLMVYAVYIGICAYLATKVHVGLRFENFAPDRRGGDPNELQLMLNYFREFSYSVDIIFDKEVKYWDTIVQNSIDSLYEDLLGQPHVGSDILCRNWLRDYVKYAEENRLNIWTEEEFVYNLRFKFLHEPNVVSAYLGDIRFANHTIKEKLNFNGEYFPKIMATRFIIQVVDMTTMDQTGDLITGLKNVKRKYENESIEFNVFTGEFSQVEPMMSTTFIVVSNTLIQLAAIMLVTTLMMPHPIALFWIAVILSSITLGVITITCSWDIDFDQIAMVNIMLTMGYCVDFSAHMTRTYVHSKAKTRYEKTREALGNFGFPIIQSSIAAFLAVVSLGASYAYILNAGFKFFLIGISLSVFHTMLVFPVLLLYLGPQPQRQEKKIKKPRTSKTREDDNDDDDVEEQRQPRHSRKPAKHVEHKHVRRVKESKLGPFVFPTKPDALSLDESLVSMANGPVKRTPVPRLKDLPYLSQFANSDESSSGSHSYSY